MGPAILTTLSVRGIKARPVKIYVPLYHRERKKYIARRK